MANILETQRPFLSVDRVEVEQLGLPPLSLPAYIDPADPDGTLEGKSVGTIMVINAAGQFKAMEVGDTAAGFTTKAILASNYSSQNTAPSGFFNDDPLAEPGELLNSSIIAQIPERNAAYSGHTPLATGLRSGTVYWLVTPNVLADGAVINDPDGAPTIRVLHGAGVDEPKKFLVL